MHAGGASRLLRDGEGWAFVEFPGFARTTRLTSTRPVALHSTIGGKPAQTIDELPLEWFHAPGVV